MAIFRPSQPTSERTSADPVIVRYGVIRVILTGRRSLPVYPDKQTISEAVGTSHLGHELTLILCWPGASADPRRSGSRRLAPFPIALGARRASLRRNREVT
jgi:hypothetical protein